MNPAFDTYIQSMAGRDVTVIGAGVSNAPLIRMLCSAGALDSARAGGSRVTSEMEEFFGLCPCPIFSVTGSDGKTTTTSLIADMLANGGRTVHFGGNIGTPLLTRAGEMSPLDVCADSGTSGNKR